MVNHHSDFYIPDLLKFQSEKIDVRKYEVFTDAIFLIQILMIVVVIMDHVTGCIVGQELPLIFSGESLKE